MDINTHSSLILGKKVVSSKRKLDSGCSLVSNIGQDQRSATWFMINLGDTPPSSPRDIKQTSR